MKVTVLLLLCIQGYLGFLRADDRLIQAEIANNQLAILNRLSAMQHPPKLTNQLQKISFNEIMTAIDQGYSSKEIFDRAQMTNDPRLPNWNKLGGYKVHPNITAYLSPMNSHIIAAEVAPTPEPLEDLKLRLENEARMKESIKPPPAVTENNQKQEMQNIFQQMELLQAKARAKVLHDTR